MVGQGVIIGGRVEFIPELEVLNYKQPGRRKLKLLAGEDMRHRRTRWVRSIVWHTTKGVPTCVRPGVGPSTALEERISRLWANDGRHAGAHLSVDWDGTIGCHADLLDDAAYHAPGVNEVSIGIELYEDNKGHVYEAQLEAAVTLTDWLTARFGIQRQMPLRDTKSKITRLARGGKDFVGVYGHRHVGRRGPGDPGDDIFRYLAACGYQEFDIDAEKDKTFWRRKQVRLGITDDGVPGPITCDTLRSVGYRSVGYPHGLWMPAEAIDPAIEIEL